MRVRNNFRVIAALFTIAALMLGLAGCADFERKAFQTLAADKAVIDQAVKDYNSGTLPQVAAARTAIDDARSAHNAAVESFLYYEQVKSSYAAAKSAGKDLSQLEQQMLAAQSAVTAALSHLDELVQAIKATYQQLGCGGKPNCATS